MSTLVGPSGECLWVHKLHQLFQAGSKSRSVGLGLSRRPPSTG